MVQGWVVSPVDGHYRENMCPGGGSGNGEKKRNRKTLNGDDDGWVGEWMNKND